MKYLPIYIIFLSLAFLGCKKEETQYSYEPPIDNKKKIVITGFIYDSLSGNPINNVPVSYKACTKEGQLATASSSSDQNGKYLVYALWNMSCINDKPAQFHLRTLSSQYPYSKFIDLSLYEDGDTIQQDMLIIH